MFPFKKARLRIMMFLQFFIWGAWYATAGNYMKSNGMTDVIYLAYMASPIGSIVSPFILGMIADRFFPVQKVLGVMHILSGIFVFCVPFFAEGNAVSVPLFLVFLLLHMLCYMPTVGLATATAFHLLLISVPFATYFAYVPVFLRTAHVTDPAFKMTFGQMSEVIFLMLLPWFFSRLGLKWVLLIGMFAWMLRYSLFALAAPEAIMWM